ncbi:DUF2631 domain-containing protein [Allorhizocola rhizosphaerae]|uniref:DUF2631 domain-containing protein n=1 Tax=Allorhizocola rhizosphaerae TaxID=1872709 RepID=UPI000E3E4831|nr:DUF2631 domain-containing protein [Allorhizocola rhizosphaerae]
MASEEPVTSPDQHKPTPIKLYRIAGVVIIVSLLLMLFGNNEVNTGAPWLIGTAALIAIVMIVDAVQRRNGLKD